MKNVLMGSQPILKAEVAMFCKKKKMLLSHFLSYSRMALRNSTVSVLEITEDLLDLSVWSFLLQDE